MRKVLVAEPLAAEATALLRRGVQVDEHEKLSTCLLYTSDAADE